MTSLRILFQMMKADYVERVRSYSFLITALVSIFIVFKFLPSSDEGYLTLSLNDIRGVYNSAWVGSAIAVLASMLLSLPAFFLVKNAIERDVQTGVGQILATTPITRWIYTMGKMWSNFVLLMSIVAVMIVSALALQLIRGEAYTVDWVNLLLPFLYSTLPTTALVASLAIFFESVPLLRNGIGNVVYFILWGASIKFSTTAIHVGQDMLGISPILTRLSSEANARLFQNEGDHVSGFSSVKGAVVTYDWAGVHWTLWMFLERYVWLAAAVALVALSSIFFHRFDLTRSPKRKKEGKLPELEDAESRSESKQVNDEEIRLTPYTHEQGRTRYFHTLAMELRLMLKGLRIWWYLIALLMVVLGLLLPIESVLRFVLPFTWVWPVLIWSAMGTNETYYRTHQLIFTAVHPVRNQFIALWVAGIVFTYLTGIGAMIHFLVGGEWGNVTALAVGGLFIPTLAVASGIWSGSGKLFQFVFMLLWYLGPVNKWSMMDFMGTSPGAVERGVYWYYLLATIVLFFLALIGRVRQVKRYR